MLKLIRLTNINEYVNNPTLPSFAICMHDSDWLLENIAKEKTIA